MQTKVYCRTSGKGIQSYFVRVDGNDYFLFSQKYRKSNKEYFGKGVGICLLGNYSGAHSTSVRKTLDKLPTYIRYVEKEYGVFIYNKTKNKRNKKRKSRGTVFSDTYDFESEAA